MSLENTTINQLFLQKLASEPEKTAAEAGAYIRTKLREVSFARKILPPVYVTAAELQRSVYHDQPVRIIDKEPDSTAMVINFRGQPNTFYVEGERFEVNFWNITSDEFEKAEEELMVYEMPIMEILERNTVKDIQYQEDYAFIKAVDQAIATNTANYTGRVNRETYSGSIDPAHFVALFDVLEDAGANALGTNPLMTDCILMNQKDFNKILLWTAQYQGDDFATMITTEGFTYPKLMGKKVITTIKGNLVPPGTMYAFASPEFLGKFFLMGDIRFFIEKKRNIIIWSALETVGMAIGNIEAIAKCKWVDYGTAAPSDTQIT